MEYLKCHTFDEVVNRYNSIKPLRGKGDADIRPFGSRRRPGDRIIKISDTCYAVVSGWNNDPVYGWSSQVRANQVTLDVIENSAPIVWRREPDGSETVTVRRSPYSGSISHCGHLERNLPTGVWFHMERGAHYIKTRNGQYVLEAGETTDPADCVPLKLRYVSRGDWVAVDRPVGAKEKVLRRVDKAAKAELKPHMAAFFEWLVVMAPIIGPSAHDWKKSSEVREKVVAWFEANAPECVSGHIRWGSPMSSVNIKGFRLVMGTDNHPLKVELAMDCLWQTNIDKIVERGDLAEARKVFTDWATKALGLKGKVKVDVYAEK